MNRFFSLHRLGTLLRADWRLGQQRALIVLGASILIVALLIMISPDFGWDGTYSRVLTNLAPLTLLFFGLSYYIKVHSTLHSYNALPYITTPTTTLERYLHLLIVGALFYLSAIVVIQAGVAIEYLLRPSHFPTGADVVASPWLIEGSVIVDPLFIFRHNATWLYFIGILFLISVAVPSKRWAYPLYFIAPLLLMLLLSETIFKTNGILLEYVATTIGVVCIVASYFALQRLQLKS